MDFRSKEALQHALVAETWRQFLTAVTSSYGTISDSYGVSLGRMRRQPSKYFDKYKLGWMQATNYWKDCLNKLEN
jgi:hypothetical protein